MTNDELKNIGSFVLQETEDLFHELGISSDFCIQHIGHTTIVFGGINRIIWSPHRGYKIDEGLSRPSIVQKFRKLYNV